MKLGIVVGHERKKPGVRFIVNGKTWSEYDYNTLVAKELETAAKASNIQVKTFFRDGVGIVKAHEAAEKWGSNVVLELHCNSFPDTSVKGSEVLCASTSNGSYASVISRELSQLFEGPDRGNVCPADPYVHGWINVNRPIPTFLLEPFFASNEEQALLGVTKIKEYAQLIMRVTKEFYP